MIFSSTGWQFYFPTGLFDKFGCLLDGPGLRSRRIYSTIACRLGHILACNFEQTSLELTRTSKAPSRGQVITCLVSRSIYLFCSLLAGLLTFFQPGCPAFLDTTTCGNSEVSFYLMAVKCESYLVSSCLEHHACRWQSQHTSISTTSALWLNYICFQILQKYNKKPNISSQLAHLNLLQSQPMSFSQSRNLSSRPPHPSTTTITLPSQHATRDSPPWLLHPVLPPMQLLPSHSSRLVLVMGISRSCTSPSSDTYLTLPVWCLVLVILAKRGILQHQEVSTAISLAVDLFLHIPWALTKLESLRSSSRAQLFINSRNTCMLASLSSREMSKQLKYLPSRFLRTRLPRLVAMMVAALLALSSIIAQRRSSKVINSSSLILILVPWMVSSCRSARSSSRSMDRQYLWMIMQAVQKVSTLVMLAMSCCLLCLKPLMVRLASMSQMTHFLAVTSITVSSSSSFSMPFSSPASLVSSALMEMVWGRSILSIFLYLSGLLVAWDLPSTCAMVLSVVDALVQSSGLSRSGFRWKLVLWQREVSQRWYLLRQLSSSTVLGWVFMRNRLLLLSLQAFIPYYIYCLIIQGVCRSRTSFQCSAS